MDAFGLDSLTAAFTSTNANAIVHGKHEDFSITDFALITAPTALENGVDGWLNEFLVHPDLQLDLSQQIHAIIATTYSAGLPALPAKALAINHRQTVDFDPRESLFHSIKP